MANFNIDLKDKGRSFNISLADETIVVIYRGVLKFYDGLQWVECPSSNLRFYSGSEWIICPSTNFKMYVDGEWWPVRRDGSIT